MATHSVPLPALAVGQSLVIALGGKDILLCRVAAGLLATNDLCPHQDKSLEGCRIRGGTLICPHHGARFSLEDGRSLSPLTPNGLKLFACRENGAMLEIDL